MAKVRSVELQAVITYDDGTEAFIGTPSMMTFVRGGVPMCIHDVIDGLKQGLVLIINRIKRDKLRGLYDSVTNPIVPGHMPGTPGYSKS